MKPYKNLRSYIAALDKMDDIAHITREVDCDFEPGAITRRSCEIDAPAPLFENIRGFRKGFRVLGAPASRSSRKNSPYARVALSLGLPETSTGAEIIEALVATRKKTEHKPILITDRQAPCQQNILQGDAANLDIFPIPFAHDHDGGRYANTWGTIIVKSPNSGWVNWSIARLMKVDGKQMVGLVVPTQHLGMIWSEWAKLGKAMPYALVQGAAPAISFVSGIPIPKGVCEADYVGALWGEGVEVVKATTVDLEVPAEAEIVIEGHVSPERDCYEGPYGEYSGYLGGKPSLQPTFHVETITYRNDPIWPLVSAGRPTDESETVWAIGMAAETLALLRAANLPITTVWIPEEASVHWMIITVPNDWRDKLPNTSSSEFARQIGEIVFKANSLVFIPKIFLLDDDIDPSKLSDVVWAIATRVHPTKKQIIFENEKVVRLAHCYQEDEYVKGTGTKVIFDTLQAPIGQGRLRHASFEEGYPEDVKKHVLKNWL